MDLIGKEDPDLLFELTEELAAGSGGTIYKGVFLPSNEIVAVKIVPLPEDEPIADILYELNILKRCNHPNIVKIYGAYQKGPEIFISMELCGGGSVTDVFRLASEPLSEPQIALICREMLKALDYLHSNKIIHRDVKGVNTLLTNDGSVKLVGFGVATQLSTEKDKARTFVGTPYWMAPEVIEAKSGIASYDEKADIWALGITCIELAEVNPPLSDVTPMRVLFQIPARDPPQLQNPSQWSPNFSNFLSLCLQKDPRQRKSARELLQHPFVQNCKDKAILVDLLNLKQKLERDQEGLETSESPKNRATQDGVPNPTTGVGISQNQKPKFSDSEDEDDNDLYESEEEENINFGGKKVSVNEVTEAHKIVEKMKQKDTVPTPTPTPAPYSAGTAPYAYAFAGNNQTYVPPLATGAGAGTAATQIPNHFPPATTQTQDQTHDPVVSAAIPDAGLATQVAKVAAAQSPRDPEGHPVLPSYNDMVYSPPTTTPAPAPLTKESAGAAPAPVRMGVPLVGPTHHGNAKNSSTATGNTAVDNTATHGSANAIGGGAGAGMGSMNQNPGRSTLSRPTGTNRRQHPSSVLLMVNREDPVHRRLIKSQMNEIKSLQGRQQSEIEKKEKAHQKDKLALQNQYQHQVTALDKKQQEALVQQQKQHQKDIERHSRKATEEEKAFVAVQTSEKKQLRKDLVDHQRSEKNEFAENQKNLVKQHKTELQTLKSANKKEKDPRRAKLLVTGLKEQQKYTIAKLTQHVEHKQCEDRLLREHQLQLNHMEKHHQLQFDQQRLHVQLLFEQLAQRHQLQNEHLNAKHFAHNEHLDKLHPLEDKQHLELQEIQAQHMLQLQELDRTHHQALLRNDDKNQRKDYARRKKLQAKDNLRQEKKARKTTRGTTTDPKESARLLRESFNALIAKQDAEFEERLKAVKEEEEKSLIEHQEYMRSQFKKSQEKRTKEMQEERQLKHQQHLNQQLESRNALRLQQENEIHALEVTEKEMELTLLKEQHDSQNMMQLALFKEVETLLQTMHAEQKVLLSDHQKQHFEIWKDGPEAGKVHSLWETLEKEQKDHMTRLSESQEKDKAALIQKQNEALAAIHSNHSQRKSRCGTTSSHPVFGFNPNPSSNNSNSSLYANQPHPPPNKDVVPSQFLTPGPGPNVMGPIPTGPGLGPSPASAFGSSPPNATGMPPFPDPNNYPYPPYAAPQPAPYTYHS
eukprot:TRINITY_DN1129_c0_g1_i1.p1 TRINITY_DN1129_c0_g1~~TRINITY_DN1129_c0_g1_i1.p1  ORF type:complete len:1203 (-),score=327.68 TRINITY_DN1129_c0_g1_i1:664-4272(-)